MIKWMVASILASLLIQAVAPASDFMVGESEIPQRVIPWSEHLILPSHWIEPEHPPDPLPCGEVLENLTGDVGAVRRFTVEIPGNTDRLTVRLNGGIGDADLYLRHGEPPDLRIFDQRPYVMGNNEEAVIDNPAAGIWHLMIHGHAPFEGVSLSVACIRIGDGASLAGRVGSPRDLELAMYYEFSGLIASDEATWSPEIRARAQRDEGRAAFNVGDYAQAIKVWTHWSRAEPSNPEPVTLIGDTHLRGGNLDLAIEHYQRSLQLKPGQISLMTRLSRLLDVEAGDPIESRNLLNLYERLFPGHAEIVLAKAEWLLRRKRYEEAGRMIRGVIAAEPDSLKALTLLHGLLKTPQERYANMRTMIRVGYRSGQELALARAINDYHLLARPEAWLMMDLVERMTYHAPTEEIRTSFLALLPRGAVALEDFRIGRMSRSWISSREEIWNEEGSLILSADSSQTEAYLRLDQSDAMHNAFMEATIDNTRGFFWLYARRGEGNMIRFGFDESGLMYRQIWMNGQLQNNETRLWSKPEGSANLRLEVRADGVFTYVDGRPVYSDPLSIPRDMGLGWWGIAPWSPEPGAASVRIRSIAGGPLPVRIVLMEYADYGERDRELVGLLQQQIKGASVVAPYWYAQWDDEPVTRMPYADDMEVRLLTRYYRIRLMPVLRIRNPLQPDWDHLIQIARQDHLDGFTLPTPRMPDPEWIAAAEERMVEAGLALNLLMLEPDGKRAVLREITPYIGLFSGARRARALPMVSPREGPFQDALDEEGDMILRL